MYLKLTTRPDTGFQIIEVKHAVFHKQPEPYVSFSREGITWDTRDLVGSTYILNDDGKTIDSFFV